MNDPSQSPAASGKSPGARVVLVGAGHAHVQILASWAASAEAVAKLTLVVDRDESVYSGMVPGVIAGDYQLGDASIPAAPLARRAGAELILRRALRIDPHAKTIELDGGESLAYDVASLDVGSTVRGLEIPGVTEHALATRPIGEFVAAIEGRLGALPRRDGAPRIAVVGGGAAGIEIAFTLQGRLAAGGGRPAIFVVCGSAGLLPGYGPRPRRLIAAEASARGITIAATTDATFVDSRGVGFATGHLLADLVVWATGAASPALVADSPLPHDPHGYVRVSASLQVRGHPGLFAAGDCATIEGEAWVPKAGVHAVRAGPILDANLRASLRGEPLRDYEPQRDFLSLLNLGDRRALATKWGLAVTGRLPWIVKDRIDRGFVRRFRDV